MKAFRIHLGFVLAVVTGAGLSETAFAADKVLLKPTLIVGSEYQVRHTTNLTMRLPADDEATDRKVEMDQQLSFQIDPHEDEKSKFVNVTVDSIRVEMKMPEMEMRYDSMDPASKDALIGAAFKNLVNKRLEMVYDEDDQFVKMASTDAFSGGGNTPFGLQMGLEQIKALVRSDIANGFTGEPVGVGESWSHSMNVPLLEMGDMGFDLTYTYKKDVKIEEFDCAMIEVKGKMKGDLNADPGGDEESERRADAGFESSNILGTLLIDKKLRLVVRADMSMDISVKMPSALGEDPVALPIHQSTRSEVISFRRLR